MHGKWDSPNGYMLKFAQQLESEGFLVTSPEMPWSGQRAYDVDMATFAKETDSAIKSLRDRGAQKICIAGHSSGATGAIFYSTQSKIDCIIPLAPGPFTSFPKYRDRVKDDINKASEMIANGQGDEKAWFTDLNSGNRSKLLRMSAKIFLEQNGPDGPGDNDRNVALILPGTAVLWVVSSGEDQPRRSNQDDAFKRIPDTSSKTFLEVPGEHMNMPDNAVGPAIEWMKKTIK